MASTSISSSTTPRYSICRRGNNFQIADLRVGLGSTVGLDEADDHIDALAPERVRVLEHRVGLPDARRRTDVDAEAGTLSGLELREQLLAGRTTPLWHRLMLTRGQQTTRIFTDSL